MVILRFRNELVLIIKWTTYILLLFSVVTKLFCIAYISKKFEILGISEYCHLFALIELLAIALFIWKRTMGFGLVLLGCYFGGAIATDIHAVEYLYQPIAIIVLVFLTSFLRKPSIFYEQLHLYADSKFRSICLNKT